MPRYRAVVQIGSRDATIADKNLKSICYIEHSYVDCGLHCTLEAFFAETVLEPKCNLVKTVDFRPVVTAAVAHGGSKQLRFGWRPLIVVRSWSRRVTAVLPRAKENNSFPSPTPAKPFSASAPLPPQACFQRGLPAS